MATSSPEWRAIPGWPGYSVNDRGEVLSYKKRLSIIISSRDDGKGYVRVVLSRDGRPKHFRAHQLVALAFIGPRPEGQEVRHKDGNRSNNIPNNLEYGTSKQNREDAIKHGTHNMARKTHCKRGHEFNERNTAMITLQTGSRARRCRICTRDAMRRYRVNGEVKA